jgi:PAS domain S-box-containing protein
MLTKPISTADQFLAGGGEMGKRIRDYDWQSTPMGHPSTWPQNLKTCIRIILTSSQPMFVWWGKDLINIYNDAYKTIVRGKHPEALGQPAKIVWKEIWDEIESRVETVMHDNIGTYDEALLLIMERNGYPEETYYTFSYSPIAGELDSVDGIICANTDATERIISERQLRTLRDLGRNIIDAGNEHIVFEKTMEVIEQNPQDFPFAMIYHLNNEGNIATLSRKTNNINRQRIAPLQFDIDADAPWWFEHVVRSGKLMITEDLHKYGALPLGPWQQQPHKALVVPIMQSNQRIPYAILVVGMNPYRLPDKDYIGFFQLMADQLAARIATIHSYEEERKRAEALAEIDKAKTIFFSNISHEFRTPLTLMLGPLEDLMNNHGGELTVHNRRTIETTHRNSLRLLRLVNALLDFSRIESGRIHASYQRTDIAAFTYDLASNFRSVMEKAGLTFRVLCEKTESAVYIDREMWEKIVLNLVSNAFKYTLQGTINVSLRQVDEHVELKVKDTGVGIPEKELPRMFERFHRVQNAGGRSNEGTGIGLSLVSELVTFHHGTISVTSHEGKGSEFTVLIPVGKTHLPPAQVNERETSIADNFSQAYVQGSINLAEDIAPGGAIEDPAIAAFNGNRPTILIVDDNADMRSYLVSLLGRQYVTETAANGKEALQCIQSRLPDVVISDVMMPVMDGIELLKTIKEDLSLNIPVILLSARAGEEARIEGYNIGADDYLIKPFSAKELLARVKAQMKITGIRRKVDEAEFRYRLALNSARMGTFDVDLVTGNIIRNQRYAEIFGYDDEEPRWFIQDLSDHTLPDDRTLLERALNYSIQHGHYELEWRIVRTDKTVRWLRANGRVIYDQENTPVRLIGTVIDITNQKLQSAALKQSEQHLRDMIMQAPVSMAILTGPDLVFEIANDDYCKVTGKEPVQVLGKPLLEVLPGLETQGIAELIRNVIRTGEPYYGNEIPAVLNRFGREETCYFNFVYQPLREADHSINSVLLVASEVTEQVVARNKIREAEENSRLAIEAADLGSYSIDMKNGEVTYTKRFAELMGFSAQEAINHKKLIDTLHPDFVETRQKAHEEAIRTGILGYEAKFIGPDQKTRWLKLSGKMFYDKQNLPERLLGAVMDITEQRELQQRKDDFIRMASHELKTPVTSIKGYVQLLLSALNNVQHDMQPMPSLFKSSLTTIDRQVLKLTRLISELLDLSRIETGKLDLQTESFNLNELVTDVVQDMMHTNTRHQISVQHDYMCIMKGDKDRLAQVFINIINNAIKYSPNITDIDVRIFKADENHVAVSVKDYGIGISKAGQERIFDRFFRVEGKNEQTYPGFGIGLFIAKEIVERHSGTISVSSEKGKGSEFIVWLPVGKN